MFKPSVLSVAGSDSSVGSGLQTDLKTISTLGGHGMCVVTAVTAQTPSQVLSVQSVDERMLDQQWDAAFIQTVPKAVKVGLIPSPNVARWIGRKLAALQPGIVRIWDPILKASSGENLSDGDEMSDASPFSYEVGETCSNHALVATSLQHILPFTDLVTPNIPEAEKMTGMVIAKPEDFVKAAAHLRSLGARAVLIKGGHIQSSLASDYFMDGESEFWLESKMLPGNVRGTGCNLSSAIATFLARGFLLHESLVMAKSYLFDGIKTSYQAGSVDVNFFAHKPWPGPASSLCGVRDKAPAKPLRFKGMSGAIGFYPIVDRAHKIADLIELGVGVCQLRVKDLEGKALEQEVRAATEMCLGTRTKLFVNDYWRLAIEFGAYGVHLGQEDIAGADLERIQSADLRLGLSTHSYFEAARASVLGPSYIALGPIFPTTCKSMRFGPQGIQKISEWVSLLPYPIVAIGGIRLEHGTKILASGVSGIALISDIDHPTERRHRIKQWLSLFAGRSFPRSEPDAVLLA
ncbi:MAG: PfkB family carbohydrate kinase [Oligoflexales bacterium]